MELRVAPLNTAVKAWDSFSSTASGISISSRHTRERSTPELVISSIATTRGETRIASTRRIEALCSDGVVVTAAQPVALASAWEASSISRSGLSAEPSSCSSMLRRLFSDSGCRCISSSTYSRNAVAVGIRPAEVCGWSRYPPAESSAISLRMVADDTLFSSISTRVLEPTGSPVRIYSSMIAFSIRFFRSPSSI